MKGNKRLILVLVLGMLVLAMTSVQVVGANPDSQSWRLLGHDESEYTGTKALDGTTHHKDLYMNKTGNATVHGYMSLPNVTTKATWWYARYPAQIDGLTFGGDDWTVNISHGPTDGCTIWANVCRVNDSTGEVTYLANGSVVPLGSGADTFICHDNPDTYQIFNTSERLALRIYHNRTGTTTTLRIYYYNATSRKYSNLTSPASDPGYPVPELSTLILFSTGLLTLAGYVLLARRRK